MNYYDDEDYFDDDDFYAGDGTYFARSGSALRAETASNPRNLPCPTCGRENVLTPADRAKGYQCDRCADAAEGIGWGF
jgi:ribosomal protein L37AE/L43A